MDWIDIHHPADSLFLKAPLAAKAGGSEKCRPAVVYKDQNDPDYKALAEAVQQAVKKAWDFPRRDVQALVVEREENRRPQKLAKEDGESRRE